jgi:hypothetical protein
VIRPGDIISYIDMCREEGASLQRGMNYRLKGGASVVLMSTRKGAPYADRIEEQGRVLIYEGHDAVKVPGRDDPKMYDQPARTDSGAMTQNGLFYQAAKRVRAGGTPENVRVYEKLKPGIWAFNGTFRLADAWQEKSGRRKVYKFRFELAEIAATVQSNLVQDLGHDRLIPTEVKLAVWKRDKGRCVQCGKTDNLHFDHVIPFSKGGTSRMVENIQLLCARHNLAKHDHIE